MMARDPLLAAERNRRCRWLHQHHRTPSASPLGTATGAAAAIVLPSWLPTWCGVVVAQEGSWLLGMIFSSMVLGKSTGFGVLDAMRAPR